MRGAADVVVHGVVGGDGGNLADGDGGLVDECVDGEVDLACLVGDEVLLVVVVDALVVEHGGGEVRGELDEVEEVGGERGAGVGEVVGGAGGDFEEVEESRRIVRGVEAGEDPEFVVEGEPFEAHRAVLLGFAVVVYEEGGDGAGDDVV